MKAFGLSLDGEIHNTRAAQAKHAQIGAGYGLVIGTMFAIFASVADLLLHPELPLGMDWSSLGFYWLIVGLGLAVIGFATCWAIETWRGLLYGAVTAGIFVLIFSLIESDEVTFGAKIMVLVFILMPIAAIALPLAWVLRWLAERHAHASSSRFFVLNVIFLVGIALLLGAAGGYFMKMPLRAVEAVRFVDGLIQASATDETIILRRVTGFTDHLREEYKLYEAPSPTSTEGFMITAKFEDGFTVLCTVVAYPGRDPYLSGCRVDEDIK